MKVFDVDKEWDELELSVDSKYKKLKKIVDKVLGGYKNHRNLEKALKDYKLEVDKLIKKMSFNFEYKKLKEIVYKNDLTVVNKLLGIKTDHYKEVYENGVKSLEITIKKSFKNSNVKFKQYLSEIHKDLDNGDIAINQVGKIFKDKMNKHGFERITTKSGRNYDARKYAKMVCRTETNRDMIESDLAMCEQFGNRKCLKVSTHTHGLIPRELCKPYQGKVIDFDNNNKPITDWEGNVHEVIPVSMTSFSEPAGIFGINCRHTSSIVWEYETLAKGGPKLDSNIVDDFMSPFLKNKKYDKTKKGRRTKL